MEFNDPAGMLRVCTERLGEKAGRQFAALARRGFRLEPLADDAQATGRCRLGGPALLDPGTPWPEYGGFPLSLHAVLDTDALAPWLGDELPVRPGLLNVFYLDPDVPYQDYRHLEISGTEVCRVIPADPARAVETAAPEPARSYPATPVHAADVIMLPDSWDVENSDVEFDEDEHWGASSLILDTMGGFDANTAGNHCAFGWPDTSYASAVTDRDADGPAIHLLQLAEDGELGWGWGDAGTMYFTIPAKAFAAGDFSKAKADMRCC
ncbi:YwqG family protein [Nonomuraea sp. B12E4]|uniref:YwqG family protein n=1 Tax=Nonomuraea sp. B12E4 TaxID=3153564 RepID=UPI00325C9A94